MAQKPVNSKSSGRRSSRRKETQGFRPIATVKLEFRDEAVFAHVSDPVEEDLSALARVGNSVFLSCDETAGVDRLTPLDDGNFGDHRHFNLGDWFDLPDDDDGEMDIEGLAADAGWLWIVGSHSLKREKPDREDNDAAQALKEMEEIERDPNRFFLGRVPLVETAPGVFEPTGEDSGRTAQSIKLKKKRGKLLEWLEDDPILEPFLAIPSKENGFDIEGVAARGNRVWLGLRGPVLRGHACILELELNGENSGHLKAAKIEDGRRYRKYLLPSDGLGVRDLYLDGDDMLLLLGPTMSANGPSRIVRWQGALLERRAGVIADGRIEQVLELPYRGSLDHPEGLEPWPEGGEDAFLVVYDSPSPKRLNRSKNTVIADVVHLPKP